ncbi:hypothetical protein [Paraburkholderia aspalathi]|uniref:hypothetical protein n=1 Tax=Paraburkholderia aspalathi TaxID=1324617 RepID=UPI00142E2EF6|nr:hypothetical protein [Paraburkholderia aspalathi]
MSALLDWDFDFRDQSGVLRLCGYADAVLLQQRDSDAGGGMGFVVERARSTHAEFPKSSQSRAKRIGIDQSLYKGSELYEAAARRSAFPERVRRSSAD